MEKIIRCKLAKLAETLRLSTDSIAITEELMETTGSLFPLKSSATLTRDSSSDRSTETWSSGSATLSYTFFTSWAHDEKMFAIDMESSSLGNVSGPTSVSKASANPRSPGHTPIFSNHHKRGWFKTWFVDWWLMEIISWGFSAVCMIIIATVLCRYNGRLVRDWTIGVSIQAFISVF